MMQSKTARLGMVLGGRRTAARGIGCVAFALAGIVSLAACGDSKPRAIDLRVDKLDNGEVQFSWTGGLVHWLAVSKSACPAGGGGASVSHLLNDGSSLMWSISTPGLESGPPPVPAANVSSPVVYSFVPKGVSETSPGGAQLLTTGTKYCVAVELDEQDPDNSPGFRLTVATGSAAFIGG